MSDKTFLAGFFMTIVGIVVMFSICACLANAYSKTGRAPAPEAARNAPQGADMTPIPVMEMECVEVKTTGYCHRYIIRRLTSME